MCLIAFAWQAHPLYPLIVAANRDEWRERPAAPATWWANPPGLLAGRDLEAGGTWLGITATGRFAALTNFRDPSERKAGAPSRGRLVVEFLAGRSGAAEHLRELRRRAQDYQGFNLLTGDGDSLRFFSNRIGESLPVPPGVHALSNHTLDEPWPKVLRARAALAGILAAGDEGLEAGLFDLLADDRTSEDESLPDTGIGLTWERRLAPILIKGEGYGTRCSTVLLVPRHGEVRFEERVLDPSGQVVQRGSHRFDLGRPEEPGVARIALE